MDETMIGLISMYGYFGIFFLIFIENIFPPIPSEVILLFGGSLTVSAGLSAAWTVAAASAGSLLGALALYYVGYRFSGEELKAMLSGRPGKLTRIRPEYIDAAEERFKKYRYRAVLICRCVPIVRSFISLPAGFSHMNLAPFIFLTVLGSTVWNTVLIMTGAALGSAWERALPYFEKYSIAAAAVIAAAVIAAVIIHLKRKKSN